MKINKYISESLMIVFSVLFALFINQLAQNYAKHKDKKIAQNNIVEELKNNEKIVKDWVKNHQKILNNLKDLTEDKNDSLKNLLVKNKFFELGMLNGNNSLTKEFPVSTAWETTKSTGIISEFEFEKIQVLTETYTQQNLILMQTFQKINDEYFSNLQHQPLSNYENHIDQKSLQYFYLFRELVGQEKFLLDYYENILGKLDK